jgi:hypothetical protein
MEARAVWTVPPARDDSTARTLHVFAGSSLRVADRVVPCPAAIRIHADQPVLVEAVDGPVEILLLQGRPIGEPVAQHGPFVMNTRREPPAQAVCRSTEAPSSWVAGPGRPARPVCTARRGASRVTRTAASNTHLHDVMNAQD